MGEWWFCLKHMTVEAGAGCPNKHRLGPYPTEEEASRALTTAADRNEAWQRGEDDEDH